MKNLITLEKDALYFEYKQDDLRKAGKVILPQLIEKKDRFVAPNKDKIEDTAQIVKSSRNYFHLE